MQPSHAADILAASQPLRVPGSGDQRVLSPVEVEQLATKLGVKKHVIEAEALEAGVTPLHYLRNLSQFGIAGQIRLLRSTVALIGTSSVIRRALELLAINGVGTLIICTPADAVHGDPDDLQAAARNRNASCEIEVRRIAIQEGNPAAALKGAGVVATCLDHSSEEQLVQFACRMLKVPVVLGAAAGRRGQATTVLPGDPGVALVYKPDHPHLDPNRSEEIDPQAGLMVGTWLAEQTTRLLLEDGELLRGKLLYADMDTGEIETYEL